MKTEERKAKLGAFFEAYEKRFNDFLKGKEPDIKGVTDSFAESFIESSPVGIMAGKNDEKFKEMIPKGYEFYKSIGSTGISIKSKEITLLDDLHSMVKIHWKSDYERQSGTPVTIEFDTFYFITERDEDLRIFAYVTGDEQKAIEDAGLKPYK